MTKQRQRDIIDLRGGEIVASAEKIVEHVFMKNLDYYINLPYTMAIQAMDDESGKYFYGRILEIPGCHFNSPPLNMRNI